MPIPTPKEDESRDDFLERCIPEVTKDDPEKPQEQIVAICGTTYDDKDKKKEQPKETEKEEKEVKQNKVKFTSTHLKVNDDGVKVVLTKQVQDRDGEIVMVDGVDMTNFQKNPIVLDSHRMTTSIEDIVGTMKDIKKTRDDDGIPMIEGVVKFADSDRGQLAKRLVEADILKTVSIGFNAKDFDFATSTITESELFEVSFVSVPANVEATVRKNAEVKNMLGDKDSEKLYKALSNYLEIKPKIKEYRRLLMSNEMMELVGYEKTGDELIDLKNIHDLITHKLTESVERENLDQLADLSETQKYATKDDVQNMMNQVINNLIKK